ncbi:MAG: PD-(D/E)XK nuclease family protein [Rhodospirillum sp.]|nr:PD-(D/E)XK nuclease family protein [Rhodospirillum sp.]MCF8491563.1 PD-(D/E)XK nuclease family protein [Rhodospirillum sp.]MCF8501952.1 PD-(D/E)XK nuclease family protein [Rhodospirillum sp.]
MARAKQLSEIGIGVMKRLCPSKPSLSKILDIQPSLAEGRRAGYDLMVDIGRSLPKVNAHQAYLGWMPILDAPNHAWAYQPLYRGVRLRETQMTLAMVHFLDPGTSGDTSGLRCKTFLEALYSSVSMDSPFDRTPLRGLWMRAEERVLNGDGKRRCDIMITWCDGAGVDHGVVIEVKLGHDLTNGQLGVYYDHLLKKVPIGRKGAFVLAPKLKKNISDEISKYRTDAEWYFVDWFTVLFRWEKCLAELQDFQGDTDFNRFRKSLFDLIQFYV